MHSISLVVKFCTLCYYFSIKRSRLLLFIDGYLLIPIPVIIEGHRCVDLEMLPIIKANKVVILKA